MDVLNSFLQILLPGGLVLLGVYLTVKSFLQKDFEKRALELRAQHTETVLPLRLQAYERVALLLERSSPHNLILRLNNSAFNAAQLQSTLVSEVREEFNHNLSQQIYVSMEVWALTRNAIEEIIGLINTSAQGIDPEQPSLVLARRIFETLIERNEDPIDRAMRQLKEEIQTIF